MRSLAWICLLVAIGCAPSLPDAYRTSRAAAERAYSSGRYEEAARYWRKAYESADRKRDRAEALYRQAAALRRAGQNDDARHVLTELLSRYPNSSRAARAAYDIAEIEIDTGDPNRGYALLAKSMIERPGSGLAPRALAQYASWLQEKKGPDAVLAWLAQVQVKVGKTELGEALAFARAKKLDELGRREQALAAYLDVAQRYPYPDGAYWDDALWHGSELEQALGRPDKAVALLQRMLHEREPSHLQGSYEKPRYAQAQYRIAELYRDDLHDPRRAMDAFRKVFDDFPTTLLRDDALWQEALLARRQGDAVHACQTMEKLTSALKDSRYAPCARAVCPTAPAPQAGRRCHDYLRRQLKP
jgi:tetratricopeptide (TPR) repeat protein